MFEPLTFINSFGQADLKEVEVEYLTEWLEDDEIESVQEAISRLSEYENSKLTPKEVDDLQKAYACAEDSRSIAEKRLSTATDFVKNNTSADFFKKFMEVLKNA